MKRVLNFLTLASLVVLGVSCSANKDANKVAEVDPAKKVTVETTKKVTIADFVSYNATIEPIKRNNIASASPLRIDKIFIEVGDNVKKGDVIAEMDKSQLLQQEYQLENLAVDLTRMKNLLASGGASKQQIDQLQTQYNVAKKAVSYLRENATLRSPISGVVTGRYYDSGDMFSMTPNSLGVVGVATVMKIDSVKIRINVSEEYFTRVKQGMPVEILTDNYKDTKFEGKISLIFPLIDASTHSFTIEVTIPNKKLLLRPGMYANANLIFGTKDVIILPDVAVQKQLGSNDKYLFVNENGVAVRKSVIAGRTTNNSTEVISGVSEGVDVVVKGAARLLDGDKIEVVK